MIKPDIRVQLNLDHVVFEKVDLKEDRISTPCKDEGLKLLRDLLEIGPILLTSEYLRCLAGPAMVLDWLDEYLGKLSGVENYTKMRRNIYFRINDESSIELYLGVEFKCLYNKIKDVQEVRDMILMTQRGG